MTVSMMDTVTPDALDGLHDFQAVAGYLDGRFPDYQELRMRFPGLAAKRRVLSIDVFGHTPAHALDVETGDANPAQAPAWHRLAVAAGFHKPRFYANLSTMPAVIRALSAAGIPRGAYRLWVANWTGFPHIPAGFDACQWTDHADNRNLDGTLCLDSFFDPPHPPAPLPPRPAPKPAPAPKPEPKPAPAPKPKPKPYKPAPYPGRRGVFSRRAELDWLERELELVAEQVAALAASCPNVRAAG